jgi:hypothetical protein
MKPKAKLGNLKALQTEMMARRREVIDLQKKQNGGCSAIKLRTDNLLFCYNPNRSKSRHNPLGEKFYVTGTLNGCPVIVNEFDLYNASTPACPKENSK